MHFALEIFLVILFICISTAWCVVMAYAFEMFVSIYINIRATYGTNIRIWHPAVLSIYALLWPLFMCWTVPFTHVEGDRDTHPLDIPIRRASTFVLSVGLR